MSIKVPFLRAAQIEREAAALLVEYEKARGVVITRAVPIEDIVEKHLKLTFEFNDMHRLLDVPRSGSTQEPDILGAIFFRDRRIVIDESLDPEECPSREGRYRYTLAHEGGGHWQLHRYLFELESEQISLFDAQPRPAAVCRSSQAKAPIEWQADYYASCLLMPRKLVSAAWNEQFPDGSPRVLQPRYPVNHPFVEVQRDETDDAVLDRVARPLARQFLVSPIAMRIRLETLGLLHREVPQQRNLSSAK